MASRLLALSFALLATPVSFAYGDEKSVYSGPQVGEKLPPINVALAYGAQRGKTVDLVERAGEKPILLVIVNGANRPAARLTRALMNFVEMQEGAKLSSAVVWLDRDRSAADEYLSKAISWWGVSSPVGISLDGAEGPGAYGLNRKVNVTILIASKKRVTANYAFVQPSLTDADQVLKSLTRLTGGAVPTTPEIVFLSKPTRKPPNAKWTAAPRDARLRKLICALLAAKSPSEADQAASIVQQYVADKRDRIEALANAATSLLQRPHELGRIPAVPHLRRWQVTEN